MYVFFSSGKACSLADAPANPAAANGFGLFATSQPHEDHVLFGDSGFFSCLGTSRTVGNYSDYERIFECRNETENGTFVGPSDYNTTECKAVEGILIELLT